MQKKNYKSIGIVIAGFGEGGVQTRVKSLIKILLENKEYEINLICDKSDVDDAVSFRKNFNTKFNIYSIKIIGFNIFAIFYGYVKSIIKINPDILISFTPKPNTFAQIIAFFIGIKRRIVHVDGFYIKHWRYNKKNIFFVLIYHSLNFINNLFASDIVYASYCLMGKQKLFRNKSSVIYGYYFDNSSENDDDRKVPFNGNDFKMLYLGRIGPEKGVELLIESIPDLLLIHNDIKLLMVGNINKDYLIKIRKTLDLYNLREKVLLYGYEKNIKPLLKNCHVVILPSYTESFGYVILEAWANNIPIIASNIEGPAEIIENNLDGLLFESGNKTDLIEKIQQLYRNKKLTQNLIINGKQKLKKFSMERFAAEWHLLLNKENN